MSLNRISLTLKNFQENLTQRSDRFPKAAPRTLPLLSEHDPILCWTQNYLPLTPILLAYEIRF